MSDVQIPTKAFSAEADVAAPAEELLRRLNLLGKLKADGGEEGTGFGSTFTGPPQSVALIEAGATAAAKWWATGLGAAVIGLWAAFAGWWGGQPSTMRYVVLGAVTLVTVALIVSLAHLLASDVRARGEAAAAVVAARMRVAEAMIQAIAPAKPQLIGFQESPLSPRTVVRNHEHPGDEDGWTLVAMERLADGEINYVLQKGIREEIVPADKVEF